MGSAGQQLSFIIDEGPKTKIKEIVFEGNTVFSDRRLRFRMGKLKPAGFFNLSWLSGKTTYAESKWLGDDEDPRGDRGRIEDLYLNKGYVTARVGNPTDHVQRRQVGLLQEEAGQVDAARDPGHGGRAVPDGGAVVRGADGAQGALRAQLLQAQARHRVQRRQVQEGLREAARRLRQPRLLPVDGRHAEEARSRAQGGRRHGAHGGGQAVPAGHARLHGQRLDARQGDPARGVPQRGRGVQHRGAQDVDQADQPARLLQADGEGARDPAEPGQPTTRSTSRSRSRSRTATSSPSAAA